MKTNQRGILQLKITELRKPHYIGSNIEMTEEKISDLDDR